MPEQVNPTTPVSTTPQTKKPRNWKLIGIIAVVAAILIGGGAYVSVVLNVFDQKEAPAGTTKTKTATTSSKDSYKDETEGLETLTTFTNSNGKNLYLISIRKPDPDWTGPTDPNIDFITLYISEDSKSLVNEKKSLEMALSSVQQVFTSPNKGKKFLVLRGQNPGGHFETIIDEDGKEIKIDVSELGLGTIIRAQYVYRFGEWKNNSTIFIMKAGSADGSSYEAEFDASTGKQMTQTKQIN